MTPPPSTATTGKLLELRDYQVNAIAAIREQLEQHRSTLLIAATGTGKTVMFAELVKSYVDQGARVCVLAHRKELLEQAARKCQQLGLATGIEMASSYAHTNCDAVMASVASLQGQRLERFAGDAFGFIVIDEAHHAAADSYQNIIDHFPAAKVLGVTATPDRSDGQPLVDAGTGDGTFASLAFEYNIRQAIGEGYLAPIVMEAINVDGLDLSLIPVGRGDVNEAMLEAILIDESLLHGVVSPLVEKAGDRPTVVFAAGRDHGQALTDVLNRERYSGGRARYVDGDTHAQERTEILEAYAAREVQYIVNVGVLVEGWDSPHTSCIAMARPTSSRALYTQCIGRGLRLSDDIPDKVDCLVLDFVGVSGDHSLVRPADVLAGKTLSPELAADIQAELDAGGINLEEALLRAEERQLLFGILAKAAADRAREENRMVTATAEYQATRVDPFGDKDAGKATQMGFVFDDSKLEGSKSLPAPLPIGRTHGWAPATEKQIGEMERRGMAVPVPCSKGQASKLINAAREAAQRATAGQVRALASYGKGWPGMTQHQARIEIDKLDNSGWRKPQKEVSV